MDTNTHISFEDFLKVDVRAGVITSAVRLENSKKLLKLEVDCGPECGVRTIVAGLAKAYTPEAIVGHQVMVVVNLAPKNLAGIDSYGMLLAGEMPDGLPVLAHARGVPAGTKIG
jgi:methionine--tRNA ligase beta chain